jgi:pimeloyl-ACP methyl ester carboxylesterase
MKHAQLALAALMAAACSDPAPPAAPPVPPKPSYASQWFAGPDATLNIHETAYGLAGMIRETGGELLPIRNITLSDVEMLFFVPSLNAGFRAAKAADGSWTGEWQTHGKTSERTFQPADAPDMLEPFAIFDDGRWTQYRCAGTGSPTILLDYGAGSSMASFKGVFDPLAKVSRTCVFERAARGLSDPGPLPRDANSAANDIGAFISAAKIEGPVVLVGHSMASYHIRQFANLHADQTAGLVLIDPSGDGQGARFEAVIPNIRDLDPNIVDETTVTNCSQGLRRVIASIPSSSTPTDLDPIIGKCGGNDPDRAEATLSEIAAMEVVSTNQIRVAQRPYGDLPLIVLTRGDYEMGMPPTMTPEIKAGFEKVWSAMHAEMAAQSTIGEVRSIPGAGHGIHRDQPQAVIDAIAEVVTAARSTKP